MKLDLKDSDLFGHQIKNTRRAKLLHLKYFMGFLNFYLFCEISFNFLKMSIFYGFLNKLFKKYEINLFFSSKLEVNVQLRPCAGDWRYCLKAGNLASLATRSLSFVLMRFVLRIILLPIDLV
jgi:hypothetical protein